jgi:hypothetical protein
MPNKGVHTRRATCWVKRRDALSERRKALERASRRTRPQRFRALSSDTLIR